jgi:predicted dehydrogenase/nucleoside-diphosphate-sugar epimerase
MSPSPTFRVGIVGAGHISEFHLRGLKRVPCAQVVGVTDLDRGRAEALAKRFGIPRVFDNLDALLGHGVDVIHVLTFPGSHAELTIRSLEAGCHVLVEKPLANSEEDCDRIVNAARKAGKVVCVDHAMLRDPFVRRAIDLVKAGRIGEVLSAHYFKSQAYPPYRGGLLPVHYREGSYPFRDMGVHALYLLAELLGDIEDVTTQYREGGADPNLRYSEWHALVRCRRGTGQVHLSWNAQPHQNILTIVGTRGVIRADLFGMTVTRRGAGRLPQFVQRAVNSWFEGWKMIWQVPRNLLRVFFGGIRRYHGVQQLVIDFYDALTNHQPPPASAEEARPIVAWSERVAQQADRDKENWLARFPTELTARVLVTGGNGFIGGRLVDRLLAEGHRLRLFVRREPRPELLADPRVEVVVGDLGDPDAVERAVAGTEVVYHVGAAIKGGVADFDRGTIVGTRNVAASAVKHRARMVYISSVSVLHAAAARAGQAVREDWPLEPHPERRGHYTRTKLEAEKIVAGAVARQGLQAVILRPGQVFGPGVPLITGGVAIRRPGRLIVLGDGKVVLPLIYVDDLIDAIVLASKKREFDGSTYHLVDPAQLTQNDLIERYQQATGEREPVWHLPLFLVYSAAFGVRMLAGLLGRAAPLSIYRVRSALAPWVFDCTAAREGLGWQPRVGVQSGIEQTLSALCSPQSAGGD